MQNLLFKIRNIFLKTQSLEEKLQQLCLANKIKLGLAESCTGGAIAARITQVAGASQYFAGSIVSYTEQSKIRILGVKHEILKQYSAVSIPTTLLMLQGVLQQLDCNLGLAITGIAGPSGGTKETPVGTIYIAIGDKGILSQNANPQVFSFYLKGGRKAIIKKSVDLALKLLIEYIEEFK